MSYKKFKSLTSHKELGDNTDKANEFRKEVQKLHRKAAKALRAKRLFSKPRKKK